MSFFGKFFAKKTGAVKPEPVAAPQPYHGREAARIKGVHIEDYCRRLEKEAERTGNARFAADAQRIRYRLRVSDLKP